MSTLLRMAAAAVVAIACVAGSVTASPARGHLFTPPQRAELVHQLADGTPVGSGGKDCIMCALIVSLIEQFAWDHSLTLTVAANQWCTDATAELPGLAGACEKMLDPIATKLQADFENLVTPHVSCSTTLGMCAAPYSECALFTTWPPAPHSAETPRVGVHEGMSKAARHTMYAETVSKLLNVHKLTDDLIAKKIAELRAAGVVLPETDVEGDWIPVPIPDWDQDRYGSTFTYRGIQFRGMDCNDKNSSVYPGRDVFADGEADALVDTNCNGIFGVDQTTGNTWEEELCGQTPSRGILAIGDSATAHFSLPPTYLTPSGFNMSTYSRLLQELITEADWPQCSWSTAWANNTECPYSRLNVSSIYQKMSERNRCMHRDYVNAGVNGASVNNLIQDGVVTPANYSGAMLAYPPRYKKDGPSTVFFSMIGNDICGTKTWDGYTPVDTFTQKATEEFQYLDTVLAPGSHVIIMGVVDGRVLFDTLKDAIHPIGTTYSDFYDFLNCLDTSPCWGWMNSNQTIRDASTARAFQYNAAYEQIIATETYKNFDLHYLFPDYAAIIAAWIAGGGSALELIEPVDGFHPSQTGNMLLANAMWGFLEANVPQAMGELNPNNDMIVQQFADQGGFGL